MNELISTISNRFFLSRDTSAALVARVLEAIETPLPLTGQLSDEGLRRLARECEHAITAHGRKCSELASELLRTRAMLERAEQTLFLGVWVPDPDKPDWKRVWDSISEIRTYKLEVESGHGRDAKPRRSLEDSGQQADHDP